MRKIRSPERRRYKTCEWKSFDVESEERIKPKDMGQKVAEDFEIVVLKSTEEKGHPDWERFKCFDAINKVTWLEGVSMTIYIDGLLLAMLPQNMLILRCLQT